MYCFIRTASRKAVTNVVNFTLNKTFNTITSKSNVIVRQNTIQNYNLQICRYKSKKDRNKLNQQLSSDTEQQESSDKDILDYIKDRTVKILNVQTTSMRLDSLIKLGLGVSRNKIETLFYESRIRLNGEKVTKKSGSVHPGDEIDLIKDFSPANPNFLVVARLEVISAEAEEETIRVKLRRCKSLTIENYEGRNSWQP